jgi:hypothetical protein
VHHKVSTEQQRALQHRGGERRVDAEQRARCVGDLRDARHIGDPGGRIRRGLDVHQTRVRPDCGPHGVEVRRVDQRRAIAVLVRQELGQEPEHPDIGDIRRHHVITATQEGEEDRVQCRDAAGQHNGVVAAVEGGELRLQPVLVGTAVADVQRGVGARPAQLRGVVGQEIGVGHRHRSA